MNLENLKLNETNMINITDSLEAPLLKLNIKNTGETIIPNTNDLIVKVLNSNLENANLKEYCFALEKPLKYLNDISDEFVLEPQIESGRAVLKSYVIRNIAENELLETPIIENLDVDEILLFEGENHIVTNYVNASIQVVYPKNCDLVKMLIGIDNMSEDKCEHDLYYKDCFTQIENNKINASFNKVTLKCFDSENHNFSMDCDGNLVVNSITTRLANESETSNISFDKIYPVGSIYLSVSGVNPNTYFGGTWEAFATGRTLVGIDLSQTEFNGVEKTGGHKEMQSHSHSASASFSGNHQHTGNTLEVQMKNTNNSNDCARNINSSYTHAGVTITNLAGSHTHDITIGNSGNGDSGNLQPYICVYMWKRTA